MRFATKNYITDLIIKCSVTPSESVECETVEFKEFDVKSIFNSKNLAAEISALANTSGGLIIIGIRDSSNIVNEEWSNQLVGIDGVDLVELKERLSGKVKPSLNLFTEEIYINNKTFIAIHVLKITNTLISTSSGKYCIRDGRSSRPMEPHEVKTLITNLQAYDWSAEDINIEVDEALDNSAVESAYTDYCERKKYPDNEIPDKQRFLEAIGATKNGILNKSGLLFFGKKEIIQSWLGYFEYRFSWKTRSGELILNKVWEDNIWNTVTIAKKHFNQCNKTGTFLFNDQSYEIPFLDSIAFHEGFMNAVVHRDYTCDGMIATDYDSGILRITNPGSFYGGVNSENITHHQPRHRNISLARLLMEYQLVDRAGMGIKRMSIKSLIYGRKFPHFFEMDNSIEVEMQGEFIRAGIFVLTQKNPEEFGIPELIIINSLYSKGYIDIQTIEKNISKLVREPWETISNIEERLEQIEFCGNNDGVFIRVSPTWVNYFKLTKQLKINKSSENHVKVYRFLKEHEHASSEDLNDHIGYAQTSSLSRFLTNAAYVKKSGAGPSTRWSLV